MNQRVQLCRVNAAGPYFNRTTEGRSTALTNVGMRQYGAQDTPSHPRQRRATGADPSFRQEEGS